MSAGKTGIDPRTTLLAIKAILLAPGFSNTERRVAGALIEHFNRDTGQCDPSLERLGELLGKNIRTVERAIDVLAKAGLIQFFRHGGRSNRNCYVMNWQRFEELEREWRGKFEAAARSRATNLSAETRHFYPPSDGRNVHQTDSMNLQNRTYSGQGRKEQPPVLLPSSIAAAETLAHQRLDKELRARSPSAEAYARTVVGIDDHVWRDAVKAEVQKRGAGLRLLFRQGIALAGALPVTSHSIAVASERAESEAQDT